MSAFDDSHSSSNSSSDPDPLEAIEANHDRISDEEHIRLDALVSSSLSDLVEAGIVPSPAAILRDICVTAGSRNLLQMNIIMARDLIKQLPQLSEMVSRAWKDGEAFKNIRRLSEYYDSQRLSSS